MAEVVTHFDLIDFWLVLANFGAVRDFTLGREPDPAVRRDDSTLRPR
jgi:hypothetical protein